MATPYVKNADLRAELIKSKEKEKLTAEALDMFILMANKFSNKFTYIYEEDKEDCISHAELARKCDNAIRN